MRSKDIILPLVVGIILAIAGFVFAAYIPPSSPGPYINTFSAVCWGIMGILLTITLTNLKKR